MPTWDHPDQVAPCAKKLRVEEKSSLSKQCDGSPNGFADKAVSALSNKPPQAVTTEPQPPQTQQQESTNGSTNHAHGRLCHPFGVKPFGNSFEDQAKGIVPCRSRGLGPLNQLSDEHLLLLLACFTASDLVTLSMASKALYVYANHDELWRSLVLETFGGDFQVRNSWKRSFQATFRATNGQTPWEMAHKPLVVPGFYSDLLFQPFYCATVDIQPKWLNRHNIERRSADQLTRQQFHEQFEMPNVPVIITDCTSKWPAMNKWTDEYLIQQSKGQKLIAGGFDMAMDQFLNYSRTLVDDQPLFIFDKHFASKVPQFAQDYFVPEYFSQDFFGLLDPTQRPDFRWLIIGPERSGSSFHIDPNGTNAWNAITRGAKKWIMFPPHVVPPGVHPSEDGAEVSTPVSLMEWFVTFYAQARRQHSDVMLEGIVQEGEVIFVPHGWWHMVLNTEDCVAVTQNFVSEGNLAHVLRFLRDKPDQVSGCDVHLRPRLYQLFREAMQQHEPELLAKVEQQEQAAVHRRAQVRANTLHWTELVQSKPKFNSSTQQEADIQSQNQDNGSARGFSFGFAL